jgi:hypothetical protein
MPDAPPAFEYSASDRIRLKPNLLIDLHGDHSLPGGNPAAAPGTEHRVFAKRHLSTGNANGSE